MKTVTVNDNYQSNYTYSLSQPIGKNFRSDFKPELTPKEMLELGVFCGKYIADQPKEFPKSWFANARLAKNGQADCNLNFFQVRASQPLSVWRAKGWIYPEDPRGWFQWYCRYYMGRRIDEEDDRQIKRWKAMSRHVAQIKKNCAKKDLSCRRKQRQALLHWAIDGRKI